MIATASFLLYSAGVITPAQPPSRWMWMRSAISKTCGMLWLTRMIPSPFAAQVLDQRQYLSGLADAEVTAVGSSRISTLLPKAAALATATAWRCPPESVSTAWIHVLQSANTQVGQVTLGLPPHRPSVEQAQHRAEQSGAPLLAGQEQVARDVQRRRQGAQDS